MDALTKALIDAGEELAHEHSWCFNGEPGVPPDSDSLFVNVLRKHIVHVINSEWKTARITAIKAELALLE